jgi:hypothetical protein
MHVRRFRFFVFTHRNPSSDFRRPLVEALRQRYDTYYIWIKRRPMMSGPREDSLAIEMSPMELVRFFWRFRCNRTVNIYFNSTSTAFPIFTAFLRLIAQPGVWCLDMHDDLLYHYAGLRRIRARMGILIMRIFSDVVLLASARLAELFPGAHHLGNASHLLPLARDGAVDDKVLVLASIDERFDFDFLSKVAALCPATQFHLHGWTRHGDDLTPENIRIICACHSNIHYFGPYAQDNLPAILREFRISLAPYVTDLRMNRYIDPLRFYHCLNSGLQLISTCIPQAVQMQNWIHVVHNPFQCVETLAKLQSGQLTTRDTYTPITWQQREDRLVGILCALPRTVGLTVKLSTHSESMASV